jgi:hypothetical protein
MGQEIECKIRYQEQSLAGKAYLETDHLLFRGGERLKVLFKDMTKVEAEGGILKLEFTWGPRPKSGRKRSSIRRHAPSSWG